jgi:hypothetical protein
MINYDLDPENNRWCKTFNQKCFDEIDCEKCKIVEMNEDGHFSYNKEYCETNNICPTCFGSGELIIPKWAIKNLIEDEVHRCFECGGTGFMTKYLRTYEKFQKGQINGYLEEIAELENYIKKTSTCSICHGDRHLTYGGIPCKECGLIGTAPWGG